MCLFGNTHRSSSPVGLRITLFVIPAVYTLLAQTEQRTLGLEPARHSL